MARDKKGAGARGHAAATAFSSRELLAAISAEARRSVAHASEQATRLETIASDAMDAVGGVHVDDPPEELSYRAHRLRGLVLNALVVLAELQLIAGKLDLIASLQRGGHPGLE